MHTRRLSALTRILVVAIVALLGAAAWTTTAEAKHKRKHPNINKCRNKKHSDKNEHEGKSPPGKKEHEDAKRESCVPPAPGSRHTRHKKVRPHKSGHFSPFKTRGGEERANEDFPWHVRGKSVRGKLAPTEDPFSVSGPRALRAASAVFLHNTSLKNSVDFCNATNCSLPPDTSGADAGNTVLVTGNWKSFGAVSGDGGTTFNLLNPTTIFPSQPTFTTRGGRRVQLDGGICCDQVVQYVPQINRFIWLMQFSGACGGTCGTNKLRIASATPAVVAGGGGWTYWDLTSATFGLDTTSTPNMDYPDLAVGANSLYVSVDNVGAGLLVMRIPLSQIASSSSINIGYTRPSDSAAAYGGHLTQNVSDTAYWAGHVNNRKMRIFSMRDSEGVYRWRDVDINSWCNGDSSSNVPGGTNWLGGSGGFPGSAVLGSTVRSSQAGTELWFAWGAGHAMAAGTPGTCNFPKSHVQIEVLSGADYHPISQMQVWNSSLAFAYPAIASNPAGDVGMSLGYGGGGSHAAHAVGFWGDFVVYTTTAGDTSLSRFGDYVTIRRSSPGSNLFSAEGYSTKIANGTNNCPSNVFAAGFGSSQNFCFEPHYILFGRGP